MLLTFDLEPEWVTLPARYNRDAWTTFADNTKVGFERFLEICEDTNSRATIFVIGAYARQFPERVRLASERGHHIGSHSMWHDDLSVMSDSAFVSDVVDSKKVLEDITGHCVNAFRAPSFRIRLDQLKLLGPLGIQYDSSICLSSRLNAAQNSLPEYFFSAPFFAHEGLVEVPFRGTNVLNKDVTILGGGYLRLAPLALIKKVVPNLESDMTYLHPHDFNSHVSKYSHMTFAEYFMRNLKFGSMEAKLKWLLEQSKGESIRDFVRLQGV